MPEDPDDQPPSGPPLPPDDRLWRHPSELAASSGDPARRQVTVAGPSRAAVVARRSRRRRMAAVGVVSGLTGAAATVVALAALGTLSPRVVERVERGGAAAPSTSEVRTAQAVARSVGPAVVEVTASAGEERRQGSGVVIRDDGLILTSALLVAGASDVVVTWPSGTTRIATLAGSDPLTGLAAVTVPGSGYPTATVDATVPLPGDRAITVAAWSGTDGPTLTQGLVSATGMHADPEGGRLLGLIETDRPVPGWADGAALIDDDGHVRGVCLSVPGNQATGYAVPVEVAQRVAQDLVEHGRVDRGWLGVRGRAVDPSEAVPAGVRVDEVALGSPAAATDLVAGDVLISVEQRRVRTLADVQAALTLSRPGQTIELERARGDEVATLEVTLVDTP